MIKYLHPVAGAFAMLTIATFWLSTALSELFGSHETVAAVKTAIPWGFLVLIPALAAAGGTGFALILIPSALFLASKAQAAECDATFYAVQTLELAAGAANIALLGLNIRDGLKMKGRFRHRPARSEAKEILGQGRAR